MRRSSFAYQSKQFSQRFDAILCDRGDGGIGKTFLKDFSVTYFMIDAHHSKLSFQTKVLKLTKSRRKKLLFLMIVSVDFKNAFCAGRQSCRTSWHCIYFTTTPKYWIAFYVMLVVYHTLVHYFRVLAFHVNVWNWTRETKTVGWYILLWKFSNGIFFKFRKSFKYHPSAPRYDYALDIERTGPCRLPF